MTQTPARQLLIVEDNPVQGKVMQYAFEKAGYTCRSVATPAEALLLLERYTPDIILSDYEMPDMDGFEFRMKLLQHPVWKNIPFVFLTAHSDETLMLKGLRLHALDYIIKGTPYPVIASKLDNLLSRIKLQHELSLAELKKAADALQVNTIPPTQPKIPGYRIQFWQKPFQDYPGGDFMDCIQVDDRYTFLFLGDIMGKKWQAWFFSFGYLSYIRSAIRFCVLDHKLDSLEIMRKVNTVICKDPSLNDILSSLSLLMLDNATGAVTYTGAGDLPLLHFKRVGSTVETVTASGLLLGLHEDGLFDQQQIHLACGDKLLVVTDGVTDIIVEGRTRTSFTSLVDRVSPLLKQTNSYEMIKQRLESDLTAVRQADDASLIYIERTRTK